MMQTLLSLAAREVVITTTTSATRDDKITTMAISFNYDVTLMGDKVCLESISEWKMMIMTKKIIYSYIIQMTIFFFTNPQTRHPSSLLAVIPYGWTSAQRNWHDNWASKSRGSWWRKTSTGVTFTPFSDPDHCHHDLWQLLPRSATRGNLLQRNRKWDPETRKCQQFSISSI